MSEDLERSKERPADAIVDDAARHGETDEGEDDFEGHRHVASTTEKHAEKHVEKHSDV